MIRATLFVIALCTACASSESSAQKQYTNKEQGYSIEHPVGWEVSEVRGFTQLTPPTSGSKSKHTIVIRSAAKPQEIKEGEVATQEAIVAATVRVLRALPRAKLEGETKLDATELRGVRFSLSFTPRGLSKTYRREHAVLFGSKHLFHVIYTSPANEPIDEAAFRSVVSTLSEEG